MYKVAVVLLSAFILLAGEKVTKVNLPQLREQTLHANNDTLYVVNFWATWCKPCVAEMPYFEKAAKTFANQKVKVVFVSLNSAKELEQVQGFVAEKKVSSEVLLLSAGNPNSWIDSIDNTWSGAIPATVMYRKGQKTFFREGEFTQIQLDSIIQTKIK